MAIFTVKFKKEFVDGLGTDYPTDFLLTNVECDPQLSEMTPPPGGTGTGTETWVYEVHQDYAVRFEDDLNRCPTVDTFEVQ